MLAGSQGHARGTKWASWCEDGPGDPAPQCACRSWASTPRADQPMFSSLVPNAPETAVVSSTEDPLSMVQPPKDSPHLPSRAKPSPPALTQPLPLCSRPLRSSLPRHPMALKHLPYPIIQKSSSPLSLFYPLARPLTSPWHTPVWVRQLARSSPLPSPPACSNSSTSLRNKQVTCRTT